MADTIDDIMKKYLEKQDDFGFTTSNNDEVKQKDLTIADYKSKLAKIEELIMPLLANLHSTAEQANIHWPNRGPELEKKIKEFLALTREK